MPIPGSAPSPDSRRKKIRLMVGGSLVILLSAILLLRHSYMLTSHGRALVNTAQQRLNDVEQRESAAQKAAERSKLARDFLEQAAKSGFASKDWDERLFNMKQVSMSQQALNAMLTDIRRSPGHLFAAEQFDISVKQQDEGLFIEPKESTSILLVTLKGKTLFRIEKTLK